MSAEGAVRRWLGAVLAVSLLAACGGGPSGAVRRELVGNHAVAVAASADRLATGLDRARHSVPRGAGMGVALDEVEEESRLLSDAARGLARVEEPPLEGEDADVLHDTLRDMTAIARRLAGSALEEIDFLRRVVETDRQLDAIVATWETPEGRLAARVALDDIATALDGWRPMPPQCDGFLQNRQRWLALVSERLDALDRDAELAASFARQPFGEDRQEADARERGCWGTASAAPRGAAALRAGVARVDGLLAPGGASASR